MITPAYEKYLIDNVLPLIDQGRPGFNHEHTKQVVVYAKEICLVKPDLDKAVLVITAYLHDYGYVFYAELAQPGVPAGPQQKAKLGHPKRSAKYWDKISSHNVFDFLDRGQKNRIKHLILVHDDITLLRDMDELCFMEADTLGSLSTKGDRKIHNDIYQRYLDRVESKRISRFVTDYSKKEAKDLISKLRG